MMCRAVWIALGVVSLTACEWLISTEERLERADAYVTRGEYRAAFIDLQNALESEPSNVRARTMLADVALRLEDPATAEKQVAAARESGAPAAEVAELLARIRLARGELQPLLDEIQASKIELVEPMASTYRGMALLALGQTHPAVAAFEAALENDPTSPAARIGLAQALSAIGESDRAVTQIESVLEIDRTNALAWSVMSRLRWQRGDTQGAIDALKTAKDHADSQLTMVQQNTIIATLVEAQLETGDASGASATHADLVRRAPEATLTRLLGARLAMLKQDYSTAIAESQKAIATAPNFRPARLVLGAALLANGNLNQAEAELSGLLREAPDNLEARKLLAQVKLRLQRPEEALAILQPVDSGGQEDPRLDSLLGLAKLQAGDERAAVALMERSLRAQPANSGAKLDLALAYLRAGEHAKAKELLRADQQQVGKARRAALLVAAVAGADGREAAASEVERIVAADGKDIGVLNVAASFFLEQRDLARARTYSDRALAINPKDGTSLMTRARIAAAFEDLPAARTLLQQVLELDPSNNASRVALAQLALRSADREGAVRWLEEVRSADPDADEARFMLAAIHLQQNRVRDAEQLLGEVWSRAQDKARASSAIGKFLAQAGRYDEALGRFREAFQHDSSNPEHPLNIAMVQSALGNHSAARESTLRAVSLKPDDIPANAALTMLDARRGDHEAVRTRFARLHALYPTDPRVAVLQGDVAMISQAYRDAAKAFGRAYALQPSKPTALREYRARRLGNLEAAEAPLEAWLASHPKDNDVRLLLAEYYAATGERRSAIGQYEILSREAPASAGVLNNLAWLYFQEGDPRAEAIAKKALDLAPDVPAIADTYGWILVRGGNAEAGLPILERAAANAQATPEILYHFAAALSAAGQRDKARAALDALLRTHEDFSEVKAARELLASLGD